ncbi:retrovirus-related Pol polyprotein from transposon 412 [Trichonephila clavipes]|nr:retrovirus-related Pol polyprotein from transposon 412 [Trichonephila clavipes]
MIRWALKLSEFNIEWEHRPGVQNVVADLLSRNLVDSVEGSQISCAALRALTINSREQFIKEEREDPELGHIYRYLENPADGSVNATSRTFFMNSVASTLNRVAGMEFNNQISVLTPNNWNTWKHDMQVLLMHYGCWQIIIQTKPEQPDEEATYKEKLDLQLRKDRCYTLIYTNISSDLKNLITETTDGVAAWKILKDHFEPVTKARVIQLLDQFFLEQNTNQGKMLESSYLVVVKIEAELILEANRLQLMKQDLEKAENAYLSSFTSKKSKTLPGATAAADGDPNGKNDYQKKGEFDKGLWVIDTAATSHFCNDKSLFLDLKPITNMKMSLATEDKSCPVEGIGTLRFRTKVNSNLRYNLNLPDYYDDEDDFDRVKDSLTSRLVSKTSTEMPSTSENPDVSSDNHSLIPCTEVKWIRNIGRKVTGSNVYYSIEGEATRLKSFNEIERYCKRHNIEYDPSLFNFRKDNTESQGFSDLSEQQALMVEVTIPNCYKQAIRSRDASKWHNAMDKEINVMKERKVWDLVDHPDNIKILENRWVYTIKYDENNKIVRYKARLVARGNTQLRDTDFATNRDDRVSMGGFITFIDETPISWRTFKQKSVSLSTMEADLPISVTVYIPGSLRKDIMKEFRDLPLAGHLGKRKTYLKLRDTCYFPFMRKYMFEYVSTCDRCQKFNYKNALPAGRLMPIVSKYSNEIVTLDLLGPYPASRPERYKFILVISDHFTKWCELIPLRKASAQAIANAFFDNYIARYGAPISLISDNGPQFISDVFEHLSHRLDIKHMKTVTYRPQANLTERVNRNLVQMIASFVEENHENWDQFLHEFAFALRTAVNETTNKTPAKLFLGRKIVTPFSKLINVTEDTKYVGRNIERLFDEARRNMRKKHKSWEKYYNRRRRDVHIKVNDLVLLQTHFLSTAGRKQVGKFMSKFEGPYRVLEIKGNNLIIWKSGRNMTVNIDQVRVYRPRQIDMISSDSPVGTLYDEQEVSHGSNRSNQGQFKEHRKTSSQESERCRSRQGNTAREIPRNKRKLSGYESKDQVLKRSKTCRKRSLQGSEHQDRKRRAPEQRQEVKRSIPSSISSRTYKFKRPNNSSPGVESIAGPSRLPDRRRSASTTVGSRTEGSGRDNQTRQTRATTRRRNKQAERPVRSNQAATRRPCPYYLRSRVKKSDGIPEEQRNIEINGIPHNRIRRRSLSMEALDGDPVHRNI